MSQYEKEINRRRTFAIISHPDAGKTTLTEKLLLYTGSIQTAGSVKGKSSAKHAVSDWMDIEKERGITITSAATTCYWSGSKNQFKPTRINIIDTPGHADFGGEVERVLKMVNGVLLLVDAAEG